MPFPTIPTGARVLWVTNTTGGATKTSPDLSSLTKNAGDLLLAICIEYDGNSTNAEFSAWGGGFTELPTGGDNAGTATMAIGVAYKKSTGSETGTFTVTTADTSANDSAFCLLSIPGWYTATPPEAGSFTTGTGASNPASFNPPGWGTEDTLWIAVAGSGETATTGSYTGLASAPAGFGSYAESGISADVVGGVEGAVAFLQQNAASQDVAAFTGDTSNARDAALVIAVLGALTISPTLTADAVIYKAQSASFTADAVILKNVVASSLPVVVDSSISNATATSIDVALGTILEVGDTAHIVMLCPAGSGPTWGSTPGGWTSSFKTDPNAVAPGYWGLAKTVASGDIGASVNVPISSSVQLIALLAIIRHKVAPTVAADTAQQNGSTISYGGMGSASASAGNYRAKFGLAIKANTDAVTFNVPHLVWTDTADGVGRVAVVAIWTSIAGIAIPQPAAQVGTWGGGTHRVMFEYIYTWSTAGFAADAVIASGAAAQTPFLSKQMLQLIAQ